MAGAINRANGGITGTVNAPKAELITSFTSSGTFSKRKDIFNEQRKVR